MKVTGTANGLKYSIASYSIMNAGIKILITIIAVLVVLALIYGFIVQNPQHTACTEEAKLCPDGSSVGRVPPSCDFAPCPSVICNCPTDYVQEGDVCNPKCYYSTPKCLSPSIPCNSSVSIEDLCIASGGTVKTQLCCKAVDDFPNTCLIGGCGCSSDNSHNVKICDCGENKCWDNVKNECVNL